MSLKRICTAPVDGWRQCCCPPAPWWVQDSAVKAVYCYGDDGAIYRAIIDKTDGALLGAAEV